MKTNLELVAYCKHMAEDVHTMYVLGTYGQELTTALLNQKCAQLSWNDCRRGFLKQFVDKGYIACDCSGLIKGFLWSDGGKYVTAYNASEDENDVMMYERAKVKGSIDTLPEIPGVLVFQNNHVGVYAGNGYAYECTPNMALCGGWGVYKTRLKGRGWTKWAEYARIEYIEAAKEEKPSKPTSAPSLKPADDQIDEDGYWGIKTTKKAQRVFNTTVDGIVSNQYKMYKAKNPGCQSDTWKWLDRPSKAGSQLIKAIQRKVGAKVNGFGGPETFSKMQRWLGTKQDGVVSSPSQMVKVFQHWLNKQ